jgi:transcriptional regulator with XRE-family HTH domain
MNLQNPETIAKIAIKLKQLRVEKGFTSYEDFALEYDLSRSYYWKVEKGQNMTLDYLISILKIHGVSLKEFFSDIE